MVIDTDCTGSCKSNYQTITTTTALFYFARVHYCNIHTLSGIFSTCTTFLFICDALSMATSLPLHSSYLPVPSPWPSGPSHWLPDPLQITSNYQTITTTTALFYFARVHYCNIHTLSGISVGKVWKIKGHYIDNKLYCLIKCLWHFLKEWEPER
jgi:hypothetical protein